MFRGRTHDQNASTIAVSLSPAEDALAVRPQDLETAIPIGTRRCGVKNTDSAAKPLTALPENWTPLSDGCQPSPNLLT